jgi:hypothetical protein
MQEELFHEGLSLIHVQRDSKIFLLPINISILFVTKETYYIGTVDYIG